MAEGGRGKTREGRCAEKLWPAAKVAASTANDDEGSPAKGKNGTLMARRRLGQRRRNKNGDEVATATTLAVEKALAHGGFDESRTHAAKGGEREVGGSTGSTLERSGRPKSDDDGSATEVTGDEGERRWQLATGRRNREEGGDWRRKTRNTT